jgi:hypothetical protein
MKPQSVNMPDKYMLQAWQSNLFHETRKTDCKCKKANRNDLLIIHIYIIQLFRENIWSIPSTFNKLFTKTATLTLVDNFGIFLGLLANIHRICYMYINTMHKASRNFCSALNYLYICQIHIL